MSKYLTKYVSECPQQNTSRWFSFESVDEIKLTVQSAGVLGRIKQVIFHPPFLSIREFIMADCFELFVSLHLPSDAAKTVT